MKAMVSGATGFIGSRIINLLLDRGWQVNALVRERNHPLLEHPSVTVFHGNLDDDHSVSSSMINCDVVFHTAALTGFWAKDPGEFYRTNVEGTRRILRSALEVGVPRVIHTSTWATIGRQATGAPATEESRARLGDLPGHYRTSKFLAEEEVASFVAEGLDVVIVNPTVPIGIGDRRPTPSGSIILDFLRGRLPAYVDAQLNIIDVDNAALGHILAWERGRTGHRYILGNWNMTLQDLLSHLSEITGIKPPRIRLPIGLLIGLAAMDNLVEGNLLGRQPFIPIEGLMHARSHTEVDCSKAITELGLPVTPVIPSLVKAIEWFKVNGYVTRY